MTEVWTEERVGQLRTLYADLTDWSFAEMAAKLGGVTRNAVIGKAHRLGLERRQVGRNPKPMIVKPPRVRKSKTPLPPGAPKFNPQPFLCADAADIVPRHLSIADLEENDCRQPYGDGPEFTFCGHPKLECSSYCPSHHRLNRAGIPTRKNVHATTFGQSKGGVFGRVA